MSWNAVIWLCLAVFIYDSSAGTTVKPPSTKPDSSALVGREECLEGPSYWCQNFTTAKQCNANRHCIRTVWEYQELPPDNNEVCNICKKEVTEARDMLKSNETQENMKMVLEGSCFILIPIKPVARECAKLMDQAIPQIIEALASQMNPQVVCATAGLCNSVRINALIAKYKPNVKPSLDCGSCMAVAGMANTNFRSASRDHVLNSMLEVCGRTGSFSDGCSAFVIVHFNRIYEHLVSQFSAQGLCHLSGVCQQRFHSHSELAAAAVPKLEGDVPCELCEQLVMHLRTVLVSNTTEKEFEQVLLGLCLTTKSYKKQCTELVKTYYPEFYAFLTQELDGKILCTQIGICPKNNSFDAPLYPLLPVQVAQSLQKDSSGLHRVPLTSAAINMQSQLPLDRLVLVPQDKDLCQMCEYFLHFLQIELTNPVNEQAIIKRAETTCDSLPEKYAPNCRSFVDTYATVVIALLAQDIDPSQVCPKIGVCPGVSSTAIQCEPCRAATLQLTTIVGSNTTESNIQKQLLTLCLMMPYEESRQCSRLLALHHEDLSDMTTAQFTSEEMCAFMKYCSPEKAATTYGGYTETNEIPKTQEDEDNDSGACALCELIMTKLEKMLENNQTEAQIRHAVEEICIVVPKTVKSKCHRFIGQYIDLIVTLLVESVSPKDICEAMQVCNSLVGLEYVRSTVTKCVVCESLMGAMQGVMEDRDVERNLNMKLERACFRLPMSMKRECLDVVRHLAPQIEVILGELPLGPLVCHRLDLCHAHAVDLVQADRCSEGQGYWCLSTVHAAVCQKIEHCQKNVWLAGKPILKSKRHTNKFVF